MVKTKKKGKRSWTPPVDFANTNPFLGFRYIFNSHSFSQQDLLLLVVKDTTEIMTVVNTHPAEMLFQLRQPFLRGPRVDY